MKYLILLLILVGCSLKEQLNDLQFRITCIDGVEYFENGDRLLNNYSMTVKFNSNGKVSTCGK